MITSTDINKTIQELDLVIKPIRQDHETRMAEALDLSRQATEIDDLLDDCTTDADFLAIMLYVFDHQRNTLSDLSTWAKDFETHQHETPKPRPVELLDMKKINSVLGKHIDGFDAAATANKTVVATGQTKLRVDISRALNLVHTSIQKVENTCREDLATAQQEYIAQQQRIAEAREAAIKRAQQRPTPETHELIKLESKPSPQKPSGKHKRRRQTKPAQTVLNPQTPQSRFALKAILATVVTISISSIVFFRSSDTSQTQNTPHTPAVQTDNSAVVKLSARVISPQLYIQPAKPIDFDKLFKNLPPEKQNLFLQIAQADNRFDKTFGDTNEEKLAYFGQAVEEYAKKDSNLSRHMLAQSALIFGIFSRQVNDSTEKQKIMDAVGQKIDLTQVYNFIDDAKLLTQPLKAPNGLTLQPYPGLNLNHSGPTHINPLTGQPHTLRPGQLAPQAPNPLMQLPSPLNPNQIQR